MVITGDTYLKADSNGNKKETYYYKGLKCFKTSLEVLWLNFTQSDLL